MDRTLIPGGAGTSHVPTISAPTENSDPAEFFRHARDLYPGARQFDLECNFYCAGIWGGVDRLVEMLWKEIGANDKDLIEDHSYELARVVPWLVEGKLEIRKTLTDAAPEIERVRSYAADRALRVPHGIIDLIVEYKQRISQSDTWVLNCHGFGKGSPTAQLFYTELERIAPAKLRIAVNFESAPESAGASASGEVGLKMNPRSGSAGANSRWAATLGKSLDDTVAEAGHLNDQLPSSSPQLLRHLPRLIAQCDATGRRNESARLRLFGLSYYCAEGFYSDAVLYAEGLNEDCARDFPSDHELRWTVAYKTLNAHLGANNIDLAFDLATGLCEELVDAVGARTKANLLYLQAMIYARFRQPRDLMKGEELLNEAIRLLSAEEIPAADYHFSRVFFNNGIAMIRVFQSRHEDAIALCRNGIEEMGRYLDPAAHRLHRSVLVYNIAQVYTVLGDNDRAIAHLNQAIELDPNYSEYYNDRGNLYFARRDFEAALRDYNTSLSLSPPYHEVLVNLGQCYRLLERYEEALGYYERALQLRPSSSLAKIGKASCLHQLSKFEDALREYAAVQELNPSMWEIHANRAALYCELDQYDCALEEIDEAIRLNPYQPELIENRLQISEALSAK